METTIIFVAIIALSATVFITVRTPKRSDATPPLPAENEPEIIVRVGLLGGLLTSVVRLFGGLVGVLIYTGLVGPDGWLYDDAFPMFLDVAFSATIVAWAVFVAGKAIFVALRAFRTPLLALDADGVLLTVLTNWGRILGHVRVPWRGVLAAAPLTSGSVLRVVSLYLPLAPGTPLTVRDADGNELSHMEENNIRDKIDVEPIEYDDGGPKKPTLWLGLGNGIWPVDRAIRRINALTP